LGTTIQYIRSLFKYAYETDLIDRPMRFGPEFKRPSKKTLRLERAKAGPRLFSAEEIRKLIDAAGVPMRAMVLLGINAGFGNADCGRLPLVALDLDGAMIDYPRPKTGIPRRCPLWPETVEAIREALAKRRQPKHPADAGLVFLTNRGQCWAKDRHTEEDIRPIIANPLSAQMRKLLKALGINGHRNFYTLRHTFRTIADGAKDQPSADLIMGHESPHMSTLYRERIDDARLRAVADHVRAWLFPAAKDSKTDATAADPSAVK
jgi:integrase